MTTQRLEVEIREQLERKPLEQQQRVLLARSLAASQLQGTSGRELLRFAGIIDPAELEGMRRAIEEA